jgi:hypothetical protein
MTTIKSLYNAISIGIINLIAASGVAQQAVQPQNDLMQVMRALAKVDAVFETEDGTSEEKGTALAIGRHANSLYFVTAEHVLRDHDALANSATAQVSGCPTPLPILLDPAWVFTTWNIVLFSVELPSSCRSQLTDVHFNLARGELANINTGARGLPVKILGRGVNDEITALNNAIAGSDGKYLVFDNPTDEGTSGGVAVTARGELLCVVQDKRGGSMITDTVLAANARGVPTTFLGPHARVRIDGLPEHAQVSIDNGEIEGAKPMYQLLPRAHDVYIKARGFQPASGKFAFDMDGVSLLCAELEPEIDSGWRTLRWPLLGLGAALVATGGIFGALALTSHNEFKDNPSRDALDRTQRYNVVADVSAGVGAFALLAFGVGHVVWNASGSSTIELCH